MVHGTWRLRRSLEGVAPFVGGGCVVRPLKLRLPKLLLSLFVDAPTWPPSPTTPSPPNAGQEFRAGTATFMTLCYILAVNARLLAESGGPCDSSGGPVSPAFPTRAGALN